MPAGDPASSESRRATDRLKQTRQARLHQRPRTEGRNRRPSTSAERRGLVAVGIQDARPRRGGGGGGGGGALKEATSPAEWVHRPAFVTHRTARRSRRAPAPGPNSDRQLFSATDTASIRVTLVPRSALNTPRTTT